jgi:hypothetical protein
MNVANTDPDRTNRQNAIWAGIFYILATAAPLCTYPFIGFLGGGSAGEPLPDYLLAVSANERPVIIGALIELVYALAVVGIISTLHPVLNKHHQTLSWGFFGLRALEAVSVMVHSVLLLCLLTVGRASTAAGMPDAPHFQTAGTLLLAAREWTFLVGSGIVWSLSALVLNVLLYRRELIPRWLSVWGLVGATLSLAAYLPQFYGIYVPEFLYLPIGVQEMAFALWLVAKGMVPSRVTRLCECSSTRESGC